MEGDAATLVRDYIEAWNRRDLAAMESLLDSGAEWERSAEFPEGRVLKGRGPIVDFARSMFDTFTETPIEVEECTEGSGGRVLVVGSTSFTGGQSGARTEAQWVRVYTVRDGRIADIRPYPDRASGLEAISAA